MEQLFPRATSIAFHGFTYVLSSKPIQKGELCLFKDKRDHPWLCICTDIVNTEGYKSLKLKSSTKVLIVDPNRCQRLTFSIPLLPIEDVDTDPSNQQEWINERYLPSYNRNRENPFFFGLIIPVTHALITYN